MKTITKTSKTKTILLCCLITFLIAFAASCFGQDTIITRKGSIILGKVLEISPTEIRYKKIENPDGPSYVEDRSAVSIIKYSNGTVDSFPELKPWMVSSPVEEVKVVAAPKKNPELKKIGNRYWYGDKILVEAEMHDVLLYLKNPRITAHIQAAKFDKHWQYIGFATIPCGIASLYCFMLQNEGVYNSEPNDNYYKNRAIVWGLLGAACLTTSITLKGKRNQHNAAAVKLYQQNY